MFRLILRFLLNGLSIYLAAALLPGMAVAGWKGALIAALVFGIANALVRPILLLLTLPLTILTLGLFVLVVNGLTLWLTAGLIGSLSVDGLGTAILGALLISLFNWLFGVKDRRQEEAD